MLAFGWTRISHGLILAVAAVSCMIEMHQLLSCARIIQILVCVVCVCVYVCCVRVMCVCCVCCIYVMCVFVCVYMFVCVHVSCVNVVCLCVCMCVWSYVFM